MSTVQIQPEVLDILRQSRVEGVNLYLPAITLDRKTYEQVDKTIRQMGGKWKGGKVRAHVFERDPAEVLAGALSTGSFVDEKKAFQFYETPRWVAERMVEMADIRPGQMVLEPSAGTGALARVVKELMPEGCSLVTCELNPFMRSRLLSDGFHVAAFPGYDFLQYQPRGAQYVFDRIIQNPPFSNGQDAEHLIHAFDCLPQGGRVVSVMSAGIAFRKETVYREAASLVLDCGGSVEELPADAFKESGAGVRAVLAAVSKL